MSKTLIIGSCTVDIVIPTPKLPSSTEDLNSGAHHFALGGCAYNVSQVFHLLDLPYTHATTVGSGIYGDYVLKRLTEMNIDIFRRSDEQHGACLCLVEESGERSFIAYHGVEYQFRKEWFDNRDTSVYDQVYFCGLEVEEPTGPEIVDFLESSSIKDIFFAPGPRLMTIEKTLLSRIMALHPIIHLNDQELREYTGEEDIYRAAELLRKENGSDVIVTMGKDGSFILTDEGIIELPSRESEVTDTIGAGDCHLGTYMAHRAMGLSKKDALYMANLFASEVIRHSGPTLNKEDIRDLRWKG